MHLPTDVNTCCVDAAQMGGNAGFGPNLSSMLEFERLWNTHQSNKENIYSTPVSEITAFFYVPLMATLYCIFCRKVLTKFPGIFETRYVFFKTAVHFPAKDKLSFFSLTFCQGPLEIISSWKFCLLWSDTCCLKDSGRTSTFFFNPKQSSFSLSFAWDSCFPFCLVDFIFQQHDLRQQSYQFVNAVAFSSSFCACCWGGVNTPWLTLYLVCLGARWVFCIDTHPHDQIMCFLHVEEILRYL